MQVDRVRFAEIMHLFEELPGGPHACILVPFLGMLEFQLGHLQAAKAAADTKTIREAAHAIKGGCWDLGFQALGQYSQHLEQLARAAQLPSEADWSNFFAEVAWVRVFVEAWPDVG
ncbi:MAG: Hpt domain-containing protein [Holophaga sp.]|nr:Hpt domain-containing protein [Holophaga sp.]